MPYTPNTHNAVMSNGTHPLRAVPARVIPNGMVIPEPHFSYQVHGLLPGLVHLVPGRDSTPQTPDPAPVPAPSFYFDPPYVPRRHIRTHSEGVRHSTFPRRTAVESGGSFVSGYIDENGRVSSSPGDWRRGALPGIAIVGRGLVRGFAEPPAAPILPPPSFAGDSAPTSPIREDPIPRHRRTYVLPPRPAPDSVPDLDRVHLPASLPMGTSHSIPHYLMHELAYPYTGPPRFDPTRFRNRRDQVFPARSGPFFVYPDEVPAPAAPGAVAPVPGFAPVHAHPPSLVPGFVTPTSFATMPSVAPAFAPMPDHPSAFVHALGAGVNHVPSISVPLPHPGAQAYTAVPRGMPAPALQSTTTRPWYTHELVVQQLIADNAERREEIDELRQRVVDMSVYIDEVRANMGVLHTQMADVRVEMFGGRERAHQAAAASGTHSSAATPPMPTRLPTADVPELGPPRDELTRLMRHTAVHGANMSRVLRERARLAPQHELAEALELVADGEADWARMWRRVHQFNHTSRTERSILYALTGNQAHIANMDLEAGAVLPGTQRGDNATVIGDDEEMEGYDEELDEGMDFGAGDGEMMYGESDEGFDEESYDWGEHSEEA